MTSANRRMVLNGAALGALAYTVGGAQVLLSPREAYAQGVPLKVLAAEERAALEVGIDGHVHRLPATISEEELLGRVRCRGRQHQQEEPDVVLLLRPEDELDLPRFAAGLVDGLVDAQVHSVEDIGGVVIKHVNNVPVRVRDIGRVVDTVSEKRSASLLNNVPTVSLEVLKISGSNTVDVVERASAVVKEVERTLPADLSLTVVRDNAKHIREALSDVQLTIVLGAVLTIAIIYLFLNSWRSTVITGLTLPVSIISAFFIMWLFNFTLNTMTLMALSLAIGLLIDDAIVVRENIVRHVAMGKDHHRAAKDGTDEIGLAVLSTSLAVVSVFIPVAFMGGTIGKMFFQFGVTVAFAVLVSLFVSFTLDPMLSSVWYDPDAMEHGEEARRHAGPVRRITLAFDRWFESIAAKYPNWLRWSLAHRPVILGGAALSIVGAFVLMRFVGFTWMPEYDAGEFTVNYRTVPGTSLNFALDRGRALDRYLQKLPEVEFTQLSVNLGGGGRGFVTFGGGLCGFSQFGVDRL